MKVKDLIKQLSKVNPNKIIIVASDAEGNTYSQLHEVFVQDGNVWDNKNRVINLEKMTPQLEEEGYTDEDVGPGKPCIILFPA